MSITGSQEWRPLDPEQPEFGLQVLSQAESDKLLSSLGIAPVSKVDKSSEKGTKPVQGKGPKGKGPKGKAERPATTTQPSGKRKRAAPSAEAVPRQRFNKSDKGVAFLPKAVAQAPSHGKDSHAGWNAFGDHLSAELTAGLVALGLMAPTKIQEMVLARALAGKANIMGAAPTGSGKTLAYGIPLMQRVLEARAAGHNGQLRALVIAPTRELSMQVAGHLRGLAAKCDPPVTMATIVGGLAVQKQVKRLAKRPEIVVGTPGRIADIIKGATDAVGDAGVAGKYLADLTGLAAIALDEADRLVDDGHFSELASICALLPDRMMGEQAVQALEMQEASSSSEEGPVDEEDEEEEEEEDAASSESSGGPRRRKKQRRPDLDDEIAKAHKVMRDLKGSRLHAAPRALTEQGLADVSGVVDTDLTDDVNEYAAKLHRQTFVLSATLHADSPLENIVKLLKPMGRLVTVDASAMQVTPAGLEESFIEIDNAEKDVYMIALLTRLLGQQQAGSTALGLVFVNSQVAAKRIARVLRFAGFANAHAMYGQMEQKARLKALDRFAAARTTSDSTGQRGVAVLVATDVAARGLDLPEVALVVHYEVPPSSDLYVHRAGRTARGAGASGQSIMLVGPKELKMAKEIARLGNRAFGDEDAGRAAAKAIGRGKGSSAGRVTRLQLERELGGANLLREARVRTEMARELERAEIREIRAEQKTAKGFLKRLVGATPEELGFSDDETDAIDEDTARMAKQQKTKKERKQLSKMLQAAPPQTTFAGANKGMVTITPDLLASVAAAGGISAVLGAQQGKGAGKRGGGRGMQRLERDPRRPPPGAKGSAKKRGKRR